MIRKPQYKVLYLFIAFCLSFDAFAQGDGISIGRIVVVSRPVFIQRDGKDIGVGKQGLSLKNSDYVITGKGGRAHVLLSLLSEDNKLFLFPSTEVYITRRYTDSDESVYRVRVVSGKIKAKTGLNQSMRVLINTDYAEIVSPNGEFIVENTTGMTNVGSIKGSTTLTSIATNLSVNIPRGRMTSVDGFGSSAGLSPISERLIYGVKIATTEVEENVAEETVSQKEAAVPVPKSDIVFAEPIAPSEKATVPMAEETAEIDTAAVPVPKTDIVWAQPIAPRIDATLPVSDESAQTVDETEDSTAEDVSSDVVEVVEADATSDQEVLDESSAQTDDSEEDATADQIHEKTVSPVRQSAPEEPSFFSKIKWSDYLWHAVATSTILLSTQMALQETERHNDLIAENEKLENQYRQSTLLNERSSINAEYKDNQRKIDSSRNMVYLFYTFALAAIGWESYLVFVNEDSPELSEDRILQKEFNLQSPHDQPENPDSLEGEDDQGFSEEQDDQNLSEEQNDQNLSEEQNSQDSSDRLDETDSQESDAPEEQENQSEPESRNKEGLKKSPISEGMRRTRQNRSFMISLKPIFLKGFPGGKLTLSWKF